MREKLGSSRPLPVFKKKNEHDSVHLRKKTHVSPSLKRWPLNEEEQEGKEHIINFYH
jgi:hypothetical protein